MSRQPRNMGVTVWLLALAALHELERAASEDRPAIAAEVMRAGSQLAHSECSMTLDHWREQLEVLAERGYVECERNDDNSIVWALTDAGRARFVFIAGVLGRVAELAAPKRSGGHRGET